MAFMASSTPVASFLTSPGVNRHVATSPAQAIVAHVGERRQIYDDDTDADLFFCHFCLSPLANVSQVWVLVGYRVATNSTDAADTKSMAMDLPYLHISSGVPVVPVSAQR